MFKIFDYIFYRVSDYYTTRWKDTQGMMPGIGVVSIMQLIHILFILIIFAFISNNINEIIFVQREGRNFMHSGVIYPCLIIFSYNFYRYFKIMPYEKSKEKWSNEKIDTKKRKGRLIILYIVLNLVITISLSILRKHIL